MSTSSTERGAAEKLALPLMVLSFLALGGFLYWLNLTAEPTEVTIVEEQAEEGSGSAISVDEFLANPEAQTGQPIEVAGARVSSRLGTQAFWIGPDDRPYLVKMSPDLVAAGGTVLVEQIVSLKGTVHTMSDSVLNAWQELGAFSNEGDRIVAEFATSFFEVDEIVSQGEGGGGSGG